MTERIIWEFLAACIGTIAFALLFQVPKKYYALCGLIGGCGWVCYAVLLNWCSSPVATFFANVAVVFLSRLCAIRQKCPVTATARQHGTKSIKSAAERRFLSRKKAGNRPRRLQSA